MNKLMKVLLSLLMVITVMTPVNTYAEDYVEDVQVDYLKDMCGGFPEEVGYVDYEVEPVISDNVNASPTAIGTTLKAVTNDVKNALLNEKNKVDLTKYKIHSSSKLLIEGYNAFTYSIPYLCDGIEGFVYTDRNGYASYMMIVNSKTLKETKSFINNIDYELDKIHSVLSENNTAEQNALILHDYLVTEYEYDTEGVNNQSVKDPWQIGGMLINKKGVCMGYALLYRYILEMYGIETNYVVSIPMNHAWNIIKIQGNYYHVDVTWDDPISDRYGLVRHEHFLLSQSAIENTGHSGENRRGANCTSTTYDNYFWKGVWSPIIVEGNNYYYVKNRQLVRGNRFGSIYNVYVDGIDRWTSSGGGYYLDSFSGLFKIGNDIYYNTPESIFKYNIANKTNTRVFTPSGTGEVYGCRHRGTRLYFNMASSPKTEKIYYAGGITLPDTSPVVQQIKTNTDEIVLNVGESKLFHVYPYPAYSAYNFSWMVGNFNIAGFGEDTGNIIGKTPGTTTINITSENGLSKTVKVRVRKILPFTDVSKNAWYRGVIEEAYDLGLMSGATNTLFKPDANMNRAMVACVFHRMEGSPKTSYKKIFSDVKSGQYYSSPVVWCSNKKIINGYDNGTFKPTKDVTREEMVTMICNFVKYKNRYSKKSVNLYNYTDGSQVSPYARESMQWAISLGVVSGKNNGTKLDPKGKATRAECTKMLLKAYEMIY